MNKICELTIKSIKNYLFGNEGIVKDVELMSPLVFLFRYEQNEDKDIFYELYKPHEVHYNIEKWGEYTKDFHLFPKNEGCAIISIIEDDVEHNTFGIICIYENIGEGVVNSFKFGLNDLIQEDVVGYEWFDINEYCNDFGVKYN